MLLDFTTMKDDDRALCDRNEPMKTRDAVVDAENKRLY